MSDNLSEEIKQQIDSEAKAEAKKLTARVPIFRFGYEAGWYDAGEKYAEKWQAAEQRAEKAEKALKVIANWELPPTGQYWDDDKTQPMSYGACYGSNGERDYMKALANKALTLKQASDE